MPRDPDLLAFDPQTPGLATTGNGSGIADIRLFLRSHRYVEYASVVVNPD